MILIQSYPIAVLMCVVTMICWGSWANTRKLTGQGWSFQLFYWDYALGVLLMSLIFAFTAGSMGSAGRSFLADLAQADAGWLGSAFIGGVIFNLSNILLVAAIDIAGMAVAFPVGVGLALVLGVITTYGAHPEGNARWLAAGVAAIVIAIVFDAMAYQRLMAKSRTTPVKGIVLSIVAGLLMGSFFSFLTRAIGAVDPETGALEAVKVSPYTALVLFSAGVFLSNFIWNTLVMIRPFAGPPVPYRDYFVKGTPRLHAYGILGGVIWNVGLSFCLLAGTAAGPALSYGLGQGATLVGAFWGVVIWKEFRGAPPGTNRLLAAMFFFYVVGLAILVASKSS